METKEFKLLCLLLGVLFGFLYYQDKRGNSQNEDQLPVQQSSTLKEPVQKIPKQSKKITDLFGSHAKATYNEKGFLIELKSDSESADYISGFDLADNNSVIDRAKEILGELKTHLGIERLSDLGEPVIQKSDVSAIIEFPQLSDAGFPMRPSGATTVRIGASGQILGLTSTWVSGRIQIQNQWKLNSSQARARAQSTATEPSYSSNPSPAKKILWVASIDSQHRAHAFHAYEFSVNGRQVVVDAATGEILFNRDRRIN